VLHICHRPPERLAAVRRVDGVAGRGATSTVPSPAWQQQRPGDPAASGNGKERQRNGLHGPKGESTNICSAVGGPHSNGRSTQSTASPTPVGLRRPQLSHRRGPGQSHGGVNRYRTSWVSTAESLCTAWLGNRGKVETAAGRRRDTVAFWRFCASMKVLRARAES